ncbi:MAG: hypothetical protein ACRDOE_19255, partial [Streptosporangiaceae bacterium]
HGSPAGNPTTADRSDSSVGYDTATICGHCGTAFVAVGRQRWCPNGCRQAAWRARRDAPGPPPQPSKADTVYACPLCEARYVGEQRCPDCNCWCSRVGPGGPCPHCDGAVALADIVDDSALAPRTLATARPGARRAR